jgi:hypothetical protein
MIEAFAAYMYKRGRIDFFSVSFQFSCSTSFSGASVSSRYSPFYPCSPIPSLFFPKIEIFLPINVFLCFSIFFSPEAHFHYFAERLSWLITEENYVEYPPNTIYVLTRLKSGSNASSGEIGKISNFRNARCDVRLKS